jgi:hypothetical protein
MTFRSTHAARALSSLALFVCASLLVAALPASAASVSPARALGRATASTAPTAHFRFFSPSSPWNTPLAENAPLDPDSAKLVRSFDAEVAAEQAARVGPWIGTTRYSVPIYTVGADQPTVRVRLIVPSPPLQAAFEEVPLPPSAQPSAGTDGHLVVWQPSTDRLWEFWRLVRTPEGPQASWGGAMRDVSSNPGVYGPEAWPGAGTHWGASATSLSIAGGVITLEDLRRGEINHALAMPIPTVRAGVYSSPARRGDGESTDPLALPEGAHLRLDPDLDIAALHLPRTTRLIAEAAQRYGMFVRDGASVVKFIAQDPITAPKNPYMGLDGYFEGKYPGQLLASFPWEHLQLLKMDLHPDDRGPS